MATAMEQAGAELAAAGEAERLAWEAMLDGSIHYTGSLGWAQRNLLETLFFYLLCLQNPKIDDARVDSARNHLHRAIRVYRAMNIEESLQLLNGD